MVIKHNMEAMNAFGKLSIVTNAKGKSTEKLSSGYKINRSADDAAGLSISEKMRRQIRGLSQASANAQDGISVCQIADGALDETASMLHRMEELAVKASNGTNSDQDREYIQQEVSQLIKEIDRISDTTVFNEQKLLDGSLQKKDSSNKIAPSTLANPRYIEAIDNYISVDPVIDSSVTGTDNTRNAENLSNTLKDSIVPQVVNSLLSTYPALKTAFDNHMVSSKIGLNVYNEDSSTLAYVGCAYSYAADGTVNRNIDLTLSVNLNSLDFNETGNLTDASRKDLESTIAHEMIHAFMDDTMLNGMIGIKDDKLDSDSQFPSWFKEGMAQTAGGAFESDGGWVGAGTIKNNEESGGLGIKSTSSITDISTTLKNSNKRLGSGSSASKYGTGYLATMYLSYMASGSSSIDAASLASGANTIMNKIINGKSLDEVIKEVSGGKYKGLTDFEDNFGDSASSQFSLDLTKTVGTGRGSVIGALNKDDLVPDDNATSPAYGVDKDNAYAPSDATNRNPGSGNAGTKSREKGGDASFASGGMYIQVGAEAGQHINIYIDKMSASAIGVAGISCATIDGAQAAINSVKSALQKVSSNRSNIGAYQNRLEHTIKNLDNVVENTTAAESLIRDTDMAKEMVKLSNQNIIEQAGQAMLAQANQSKNGIMNLIA